MGTNSSNHIFGAPICLLHPCSSCGHPVNEFGHHGLSCRFSKGRVPRHHMLNSIIHHSLASANIPSRLEPSNLFREDGERPDGVTMVPWSNGRFLVWDATCVDTFVTLTSQLQPERLVELLHLPSLGRLRSMPIWITPTSSSL